MVSCMQWEATVFGRWSLPEKALLHSACALLLGFFVFCGVSVTQVKHASSQDLFINPAAVSLVR